MTFEELCLRVGELAQEEAKYGVFRDFNMCFAQPSESKEQAEEGPVGGEVNGKVYEDGEEMDVIIEETCYFVYCRKDYDQANHIMD